MILFDGVKSVFEHKPDRKQNVLNRLNGDLNVGSIDRKRKKIGRGEKIREDGTQLLKRAKANGEIAKRYLSNDDIVIAIDLELED